MNLHRPSLLTWLGLVLLSGWLTYCAPPIAETHSGNQGGQAPSDTAYSPGRTDDRPLQSYNASTNQISPEKHEFFDFYTRQRDFPFNPDALRKSGVRSMEVRQYTNADNDFLEENTPESELVLSKRFRFRLDERGRVTRFERLALVGGDPLDSARVEVTWSEDGDMVLVQGESLLGPVAADAEYVDGRLSEWKDPSGTSVSYRYDDESKHTYETRYSNGNAVVVISSEEPFSEELAIDLQEEVLARTSKFVNYQTAPRVSQVFLEERPGGALVRTLEMDERRRIGAEHDYIYVDGVLQKDEFHETGTQGRVTTRRYQYSPFGDLEKVIFNEVDPGQSGLSTVHHFLYDQQGRWIKRVFTRKLGIGSGKVDRVDFVTYRME